MQRPKMNLKDKVSIITGASQGIGESIALELSAHGAKVILVDIQNEKLEDVAQKIQKSGGEAFIYTSDVTHLEDVTAVVNDVIAKHKAIDHLVNNAGITRDSLLMRMKEEDWDAVLNVNLKGAFNFSKAVIRPMMSQRHGRIVNISSVVGLMGNVGQTNYSASKAGVIGFTKALAREVASRSITVNAVAPGYISTPMTAALSEDIKSAFVQIIPLRRFGSPEDVAHAVKFLVSDEAEYITGQVINVNGGLLM
jgi:3-oxoacyl-[acyl-carrier protein] reductase